MCVLFFYGDNMNEKYMSLALKEAKKASMNGDIPVGCVIIKNDKVIAKSYNKKEKHNNAIKHAEIDAISKACRKLKTWHLDDCILYTTMEPCTMCTGAIIQSRIKKIYFSLSNESFGYLKTYCKINKTKIIYEEGLFNKEVKQLLKQFFTNIRR